MFEALGWVIQVLVSAVVVGQDGEFADVSNPQGYIYGDRYFLRVSNEFGTAYVTDYYDTTQERMEESAKRLQGLIESGQVDPTNNEKLHRGRPVYGSAAYEAYAMCESMRYAEETDRNLPDDMVNDSW